MARNYTNAYPSVTTVLGILRKIGLEMWFKVNTAKFCDEQSKRGREIGTQVHEAIEQIILQGSAKFETEYLEEVKTAIQSFLLFKKDNPNIILEKSEVSLCSEIYQFNGTIDCVAREKKLVMVDWKTGECKKDDKPKIYDEYLYQVSAYVFLWNETQEEKIEEAIIISLAKDKIAYNLQRISKEEIKEHFENAFLPALKIYNHQHKKGNK